MRIRKANPKDFAEICGLIEKYADQGLLLPRTAEDIRAHLDRFLVLAKPQGPMSKEHLLGCVSLEPYGEELAELRSLAVAPEARGFGAGAKLIAACMDLARERGISRVFAVTHAPGVFKKHGFEEAGTRRSVPEKVERDCKFCSRAATCDLVAVSATAWPEGSSLPVFGTESKVSISL